jgi:endonuclease YncB( thermonuclease family)
MIQHEGFSERKPGGVLVDIRVHALALLVPVSAQAATIIIDGDTIDIDGVRIRIDTLETLGPRCENELILGLRAKKRLRELLDGGTVQ